MNLERLPEVSPRRGSPSVWGGAKEDGGEPDKTLSNNYLGSEPWQVAPALPLSCDFEKKGGAANDMTVIISVCSTLVQASFQPCKLEKEYAIYLPHPSVQYR